jgi:hypothetical protein
MFRDAKVGDRVWVFPIGLGEIIEIDENMGICVQTSGFKSWYLFDGRFTVHDQYPTLFWDEIKIIPPPKPKRKVKKTVEGWANIYHLNPDGVTQLFMHNTKESAEKCNVKCEGVCAAPATLTYEIEE